MTREQIKACVDAYVANMKKENYMKKKMLRFMLVILSVFSLIVTAAGCDFFSFDFLHTKFNDSIVNSSYYDVWDGTVAKSFNGGNGTDENPYQISTGAQLAYLAALVNEGNGEYNSAYYCLVNSIDLNGLEWTPIGLYKKEWRGERPKNAYNVFSGVFDGKFCLIKNYKITKHESHDIGFFSGLDNGIIKNLGLIGEINSSSTVTATYRVGGIVGGNAFGVIDNCYVYGDVSFLASTGDCVVGGIAGDNSGTIRNCFYIGDARAQYNALVTYGLQNYKEVYVGGITALNYGKIEDSFVKGNIVAFSSNDLATAGGISGVNYNEGEIINIFINGTVSAPNYSGDSPECCVGGLVGMSYGTIKNSYSLADIEASASSKIEIGRVYGRYDDTTAQEDNVFYATDKKMSNGDLSIIDSAQIDVCENGDMVLESYTKSNSFIYGLNWDASKWSANEGSDPGLKSLPRSFTVSFKGIDKTEVFLDVEGCKKLSGFDAGKYFESGYDFVGWMDKKTSEILSGSDGVIRSDFELKSDLVLVPSMSAIE